MFSVAGRAVPLIQVTWRCRLIEALSLCSEADKKTELWYLALTTKRFQLETTNPSIHISSAKASHMARPNGRDWEYVNSPNDDHARLGPLRVTSVQEMSRHQRCSRPQRCRIFIGSEKNMVWQSSQSVKMAPGTRIMGCGRMRSGQQSSCLGARPWGEPWSA